MLLLDQALTGTRKNAVRTSGYKRQDSLEGGSFLYYTPDAIAVKYFQMFRNLQAWVVSQVCGISVLHQETKSTGCHLQKRAG